MEKTKLRPLTMLMALGFPVQLHHLFSPRLGFRGLPRKPIEHFPAEGG